MPNEGEIEKRFSNLLVSNAILVDLFNYNTPAYSGEDWLYWN